MVEDVTDMHGGISLMAQEAAQAPTLCAEQILANAERMRDAAKALHALDPPFAATLARGSSDQAAAFAKILLERHAGLPVLSQAPSIGSLYHRTSPKFDGVPVLAVSQSGRSPDLIAAAEDARRQGAVIVAVVNDDSSPLAQMADICLPVLMGRESSVAATKSFIGTLVALTHLVAEWSGDATLMRALPILGDALDQAREADWRAALPLLQDTRSMFVLGRGLTLPIAGEAALKLKETCGLHAEAISNAEVAHGPMTLIGAGDPVLVFGPMDEARAGLRDRLQDFRERGAHIIAVGHADDMALADCALPFRSTGNAVVDAIGHIQSFYGLANALSLARGHDPDRPPHLAKVTRTL